MKLKKINIILVLFLLLISAMVVGVWIFINSNSFSQDLSSKVSKILKDRAQVDLSFKKVNFVAFPPRTIFKDVKISKLIPQKLSTTARANEVVVEFSLANLFSNKIEISNVSIKGGNIELQVLDKTPSDIDVLKLNLQKYFKQYQDLFFNNSPVLVNRLEVNDLDLNIDKNFISVNTFMGSFNKKNLRARTSISQMRLCANKLCTYHEEIRDIALNGNWTKDSLNLIQVQAEHSAAHINGNLIFNNKSDLLAVAGNIKLKANLNPVFKYLQKLLPELGDFDGSAKIDVTLDGNILRSFKKISIDAQKIENAWIDFDSLSAVVVEENNILIVRSFRGEKNSQKYILDKPAEFFNLNKVWFKEGIYQLSVENANSQNFLQAIPSLKPLKITASGKVQVEYINKKVSFLLNEVLLKEISLAFDSSKSKIINAKNYLAKKFTVSIDSSFKVSLAGKISDGKYLAEIDGAIDSNGIDVKLMPNSFFNWSRFGGIAGVEILGSGKTAGRIFGPLDDVVFSFDVDWRNFEVVNIKFGDVKGAFDFSLKDLSLGISKLEGVSLLNKYNGHGMLYFGEKPGMDIDLKIEKASYLNLVKMIPLIFKGLPMPNYLDFNFSGDIKLQGAFQTKDMLVRGSVKGVDGNIKGERFDSLEMNFSLKNNVLEFSDIIIKKFKASLNAWASVSLENGFMEFRGKSSGLYLNDIDIYRNLKLGYQGKLDLNFEGNGTSETLSSKYKLRLSEASIANISMPGASVVAYFNGKEFSFTGNILGNRIKFDSLLNFDEKLSNIKIKIDTNEIKDILGIMSSHNLNSTKISGKLKAVLDVYFNIENWKLHKIFFNIQDFFLSKDKMLIKNDKSRSLVSIEEGVVKRWSVKLFGSDDTFVDSKGFSQTNGDIRLVNSFRLDASVLEFFTPYIEKATGFLSGKSAAVIGRGISVNEFEGIGEKLFLKIKELKTPVTNISLKIKKLNTDFVLEKLKGTIGDGEVRADGRFSFEQLLPKIQLSYQAEKVTIPLFKKTSITINSSGELSGSSFPYLLKGKLSFLHGEAFDDPSDFIDNSKINLNMYANYLPLENGAGTDDVLSLNMQFDFLNPFIIKNNLAEMYIRGSGVVTSTLRAPELNLRLEAIPTRSKFKFKGNEFSLTQGHLEIRDLGKIRNSDLRFIGISRISDYDLKIEIAGKVDKVNINLASEPPLSQEDLLSLLTLGVTNDISKNLDSADRKFVTTVGLGTLLVDQFKINEDLNSALGLKLSVLPEFQENETQLIQGKSAVSDSSSSRLKSSTKIKLDKKITKQVDLSVSSTVGGSLEQKQEMNLNFNIDRNWSVEGVYELKSSDTDEGDSNNSVGADIKYRWSF